MPGFLNPLSGFYPNISIYFSHLLIFPDQAISETFPHLRMSLEGESQVIRPWFFCLFNRTAAEVKWAASAQWLLSLYRTVRNSAEMAIGKTHPTVAFFRVHMVIGFCPIQYSPRISIWINFFCRIFLGFLPVYLGEYCIFPKIWRFLIFIIISGHFQLQ